MADFVPRELLTQPSVEVAPQLLNKVIRVGGASGRIVEVEAYEGQDDPASHAYTRESVRNRTMFGQAGGLYVYLIYGMHHCINVVCREPGRASAVLIRAIEPIDGIEAMRERRGGLTDRQLTNGPGKLCQALGIDRRFDGVDLLDPVSPVQLLDDGVPAPITPRQGVRIGITRGVDLPWRWWNPEDTYVSVRSGAIN